MSDDDLTTQFLQLESPIRLLRQFHLLVIRDTGGIVISTSLAVETLGTWWMAVCLATLGFFLWQASNTWRCQQVVVVHIETYARLKDAIRRGEDEGPP
jgi:hypothetical protein